MAELLIATGNEFAHLEEGIDRWTLRTALAGQGIRCLAVDPHETAVFYAGSDISGLWKSHDRGQTWQNLDLPEPTVYSVAVSPANGYLYAGTEPSKLFVSADGGRSWSERPTLREIPSAPTWRFPPRPWTSHVRWIAPHPEDAQLLLVGIELGGVMLSSDGGQTWLDHRPEAIKDAHQLAWHPRETKRAYEAGGGGTAWSDDYGQTWRREDQGRKDHYVWALAVDAHDPDKWFVAAAPSASHAHYQPGEARATLYRWQGVGPWEALPALSKSRTVMPYALSMAGGRLFAGFADGTIFSTPDDGDTWQGLILEEGALKHIMAMIALA
ncbi:MAG: hypothetical protein ACK2UK_22745 [Candidatus Promineifilaceae bacterium]